MEAGGFALNCANIRELARQMLMMRVSRGFSMPYRDGCPGHNWLAGFLKRHPGYVIFCTNEILLWLLFHRQPLEHKMVAMAPSGGLSSNWACKSTLCILYISVMK